MPRHAAVISGIPIVLRLTLRMSHPREYYDNMSSIPTRDHPASVQHREARRAKGALISSCVSKLAAMFSRLLCCQAKNKRMCKAWKNAGARNPQLPAITDFVAVFWKDECVFVRYDRFCRSLLEGRVCVCTLRLCWAGCPRPCVCTFRCLPKPAKSMKRKPNPVLGARRPHPFKAPFVTWARIRSAATDAHEPEDSRSHAARVAVHMQSRATYSGQMTKMCLVWSSTFQQPGMPLPMI